MGSLVAIEQRSLILEPHSLSYSKATSYLPVIDLLKAYFKVGDRDTPNAIGEKVTNRLLAHGRTVEPTLAPLLALLDVPVDDPQWHRLDPAQPHRCTLDSVA